MNIETKVMFVCLYFIAGVFVSFAFGDKKWGITERLFAAITGPIVIAIVSFETFFDGVYHFLKNRANKKCFTDSLDLSKLVKKKFVILSHKYEGSESYRKMLNILGVPDKNIAIATYSREKPNVIMDGIDLCNILIIVDPIRSWSDDKLSWSLEDEYYSDYASRRKKAVMGVHNLNIDELSGKIFNTTAAIEEFKSKLTGPVNRNISYFPPNCTTSKEEKEMSGDEEKVLTMEDLKKDFEKLLTGLDKLSADRYTDFIDEED